MYPNEIYAQSSWVPTYYGFKERFNGAKRIVDDLTPIASLLSRLQWRLTFNLANANDAAPHGDEATFFHSSNAAILNADPTKPKLVQLPFENFVSYKMSPTNPHVVIGGSDPANPEPGTQDSPSRMLYQFGLFSNPEEPSASYVTVVNRRTWPYYHTHGDPSQPIALNDWTAPTTETDFERKLLGAVDARRLTFTAKHAIIDPAHASAYYSVRNQRTGEETIYQWAAAGQTEQVISIDLDPGEGTLLRIAPVTSLPLGKTEDAGMAYNNGHRVAELSDGKQVVVWQGRDVNGHDVIQYAFPHVPVQDCNPPCNESVPFQAFTVTDAPNPGQGSLVAAMNPSVTVKASTSGIVDTAVIVYNFDAVGTNRTVEAEVLLLTRDGSGNVVVASHSPVFLGMSTKGTPAQLVTASVTPCEDGFFYAYSDPNAGIEPGILFTSNHGVSWTFHSLPSFGALNQQSQEEFFGNTFPSVGTSIEEWPGHPDERYHVAFEHAFADGTSHIYYKYYSKKQIGTQSQPWDITAYPVERVSAGASSCYHHHPNLALQTPIPNYTPVSLAVTATQPVVTWEMKMPDAGCPDGLTLQPPGTVYAMVRYRFATGNWSDMSALYPRVGNQPLPLVQFTRTPVFPPLLSSPGYLRVILQDSLANQTHLFEYDYNSSQSWWHWTLKEPARYPSLVLPWFDVNLPVDDRMLAYTFRGPSWDEHGLYAARIMADGVQDLQPSPQKPTHVPVIHAGIKHDCEKGLSFAAQGGSVGCADCPVPTAAPDSVLPSRREIGWQVRDLASTPVIQTPAGGPQPWPITDDSIRTNNFAVSAGETIRTGSVFNLPDSNWIAQNLPDQTRFVKFDVVLKDSASALPVATIESFTLHGFDASHAIAVTPVPAPWWYCFMVGPFPVPPGVVIGVNVQKVDYPVAVAPPSGKGYLTLKVTKDSATTLDLWQTHVIGDPMVYPDTSDVVAFKIARPSAAIPAANFELTAHPNPFNPTTTVEIGLTAGLPTKVEVLDVMGSVVRELYSGTPSQTETAKLTFDGSGLASGTYMIRAIAGSSVKTLRVAMVK